MWGRVNGSGVCGVLVACVCEGEHFFFEMESVNFRKRPEDIRVLMWLPRSKGASCL
jgi:hypothetical protein